MFSNVHALRWDPKEPPSLVYDGFGNPTQVGCQGATQQFPAVPSWPKLLCPGGILCGERHMWCQLPGCFASQLESLNAEHFQQRNKNCVVN